jgi:hypothetical protein
MNYLSVYGSELISVAAASSLTLDLSKTNCYKVTLGASITTLTLSNAVAGFPYTIIIAQGGSFTIAWPASVKWSGGSAPTLSASGKVDIVSLRYDGTNFYAGINSNF